MATKQTNSDVVPVSVNERLMSAVADMSNDPAAVTQQVQASILNATSVDELFETLESSGSLIESRDRLNVPLKVLGVTLNKSRYEGSPVYCVMHVENLRTGQTEAIGCGAGNVLAAMVKLHELEAFPITVELFEGDQTANGYRIVSLRKAQESF